ncbi:CDP-glycerol glycerophosphotransferase family protein [Spiractinospora alimapuensis]|uniref:bifunctional glycosyltransferase/CDP-glycerol:glycerophosphate glycerophosphotransferase n=1 Tax=Spiractinospora alimapuensis TaxID=2820884 RepID=UPI001F41F807|nr:bifunctional glycosyltransferase/CDP-glycerol:glycerophosphate glycerophosphotransferase [Spiractinospora alimapuensis]QVQ53498.1 CDP-glycerol glycerophosphotransferase family protein [Spiractinospora alimapuensis]
MVALSVVVPIYNVERYLEECLRSLQLQSWRDLEVIMVDDGSTDGSATIAKRMASQDSRFHLVEQENGGLGAARNTGIDHAEGEFLSFVDSDDVIPPQAFGCHLHGLRESGSDFSTGNVRRLTELGTHPSPMHRRVFRGDARRAHISTRESLLTDRLVTNKVWRRDFWDGEGLRFPEGVLYEDIAVAIPAHFAASAVDVHSAPVYLWRERPSDDATSITQDRLQPGAMEDRFRAVWATSHFLSIRARPEDKRAWDTTALRSDLKLFMRLLDEGDDDYRERFLDLGNSFLDTVSKDALTKLPAMERLMWHLVRRRMTPELVEMVAYSKSAEQRRAPAVRHGARFYASYPYKDDRTNRIPRHVFRLDDELTLRQKTEEVTWVDDKLVISGRVCLKYLRPTRRWQQFVRAHAVHPESGRRVRLAVSQHRANEFSLPADVETAREDWGGYEVTLDPQRLRTGGWWKPGEWFVELTVLNRGLRRTGRLTSPASGQPQRPSPIDVAPGVSVRPTWRGSDGLCLIVDSQRAEITEHAHDGDDLVIAGQVHATWTPATVRLTRMPGDVRLEFTPETKGSLFRARVPIATLAEGFADRRSVPGGPLVAERWRAELVDDQGETKPLSLAPLRREGRYELAGYQVTVERDHAGWAVMRVGVPRPYLTAVSWSGDELRLSGELADADTMALSLVVRAHGRAEEHLIPLVTSGNLFEARLRPLALPDYGSGIPMKPGRYSLSLRRHLAGNDHDDLHTQFDHSVIQTLPARTEVEGQTLSVDAIRFDVPVLRVGSVLPAADQGRYAQQLLRERTYPALRRGVIEDFAYFESYSGRQYSDSPRDIYEELSRRGSTTPTGWLVREGQARVPEDTDAVVHGSRSYFHALARSSHVVTNAHLPIWYERHPDQTVVQTWHGSMLKRIGVDIETVRFTDQNFHDRVRRDAQQWTYLVSPSPWATPILREAFEFDGEVLETGYPRNDIFFRPERAETAARVRARLGVPPDKQVILYAPTWRDDKFYTPGKYKLDLHLDFERMRDALGANHVLLVRRHPNIVDRVPTVDGGFVHDVSTYPEIQELFLITDVLVTDYSSLMFDFANTRRPMLFFTYDLEEYRDKLRGFYFDFDAMAPGPLLPTSQSVIEAVQDIDSVYAAHKARYGAFVEQFCPLDDGGAAARVVDRVFGES